jgi:hypothetical protein
MIGFDEAAESVARMDAGKLPVRGGTSGSSGRLDGILNPLTPLQSPVSQGFPSSGVVDSQSSPARQLRAARFSAQHLISHPSWAGNVHAAQPSPALRQKWLVV